MTPAPTPQIVRCRPWTSGGGTLQRPEATPAAHQRTVMDISQQHPASGPLQNQHPSSKAHTATDINKAMALQRHPAAAPTQAPMCTLPKRNQHPSSKAHTAIDLGTAPCSGTSKQPTLSRTSGSWSHNPGRKAHTGHTYTCVQGAGNPRQKGYFVQWKCMEGGGGASYIIVLLAKLLTRKLV